jgi:hypothetical protein
MRVKSIFGRARPKESRLRRYTVHDAAWGPAGAAAQSRAAAGRLGHPLGPEVKYQVGLGVPLIGRIWLCTRLKQEKGALNEDVKPPLWSGVNQVARCNWTNGL